MVAGPLTTFVDDPYTSDGRAWPWGTDGDKKLGGLVPDFETTKADALLAAVVAIDFAVARQIAARTPDPEAALAAMRELALRMLAGSAALLPPPADAIARELVETVFLS